MENAFRVWGLFPFEANNVDNSKCLTTGDESVDLTAENSFQNEELSLSAHLNILEKSITPNKIEMVR